MNWLIPNPKNPTPEQLKYLRRQSILIMTPAYDGVLSMPYTMSLDTTRDMASAYGIGMDISTIHGGCYVDVARNMLVNLAMNAPKKYTHYMFIDADQGWPRESIFELLLTQKEIVGALYPKRNMNWKAAAYAAGQGFPIEYLGHCAGDFPIIPWEHVEKMDVKVHEPFPISHLPTGFMLLTRKAIEAHLNGLPDRWDDYGHQYFRTGCNDPKNPHRGVGEDIAFCEDMTALDFKLYACLWMPITHYGRYLFDGCIFCSTGAPIHKDVIAEMNKK